MRQCILLLCGLLLGLRTTAQDVILQTNGEELTGKVLTITPELITYRSPAADTLRIAAGQVFLIRYANGTKEVLQRPTPPPPGLLSREAAYAQGRRDARTHFRAPGVFWGTYAATVLTGYGGVATGVTTSLVPPAERNFRVPDTGLLRNPDYVAGYRRQAQNKKIGSAAGGFGAGVGTMVVLVAVLLGTYGLH
ncbi:hypothetical protein [Hymenobacter metallilatus]|uniref:PEGA domain-containing protein n=1 Tax=Hymenobacter metallilatus TaxID=2493666 RepID=A0A3R9NTJ8_9BACT|nr:hypothetical protein [Hymenobacter metallilatus]RSK37342.1 hypothetical protein EI290_01425 [Hymenobacter metallilatus]